jgi:hypothetical protein
VLAGGADQRIETRLVELLGLERWWVGVNSFRTPSGDAPVWVDHLWTFFGWPSFNGLWYLAGVSATTRAQGLTRRRVAWLPATDVLAPKDGMTSLGVAADLAWDSFSNAVNSLQLSGPCSDHGSFDCISYQLWFQSCCLSGQLDFGNPHRADLIAVKRAAFVLARRLGEATQSPAFKVCVEIWERYLIRHGVGS